MLKGLTIWNDLTLASKKIMLLFLFILEIPLSIFFLHKRYVSFLDANSWMTEGWQWLLFGICVFYFAGMLFRLAQKEMEEFQLLAYWTSLSDRGCQAYIICTLIPWMELGLLFVLSFGNYDCVRPWTIVIGVICVDVVCIRLGICFARRKSVRGKIQKYTVIPKKYRIQSPILQMMGSAVRQRLRCFDVTAMTLLVNVIFIVLCRMITGKALFVMSVIFMIFLYVLQDRVYESEGISFAYYRGIGIPFHKYLWIQVCSSILYSVVPVLIFFAIYSHSMLQIAVFALLIVAFSFYWNVFFVYNESRNQQKQMAKFWYEIISLWISIIPVINVLWIYSKYKSLQKEWNHD